MKLTKLLTIALLIVLGGQVIAQKANADIKAADKQYRQGAYEEAIQLYLDYLVNHPADKAATIRLARCYESIGDYLTAKTYYDELIEEHPKPSALYLLRGNLLKKMMLYDDAIASYRHYMPINKERAAALINGARFAKSLAAEGKGCDIENMSFNSKKSDKNPTLINGKLVYLSQRGQLDDTWVTKGASSQARVAGPELYMVGQDETPSSFILKDAALKINASPSVTADAKAMAFTIGENSDAFKAVVKESGTKTMQIVLTAYDDVTNTWIKHDFPYNSDEYSNGFPHLTNGGNTLFYASNMPGGYGKFDIYVSHKKEGQWTKPENLGKEVNTKGNEISPFLQDNKLYFASDWHFGLGGYDVFRIHHEQDKWTGLENMGLCVNSPKDDYALVIDKENDKAYFTSNRIGGKGNEDIYSVTAINEVTTKRVFTPKSVTELPENVVPLEMPLVPADKDISNLTIELNTDSEEEALTSDESDEKEIMSESGDILNENISLVEDPSLDGLRLDQNTGQKVYFVQIAALSKRKDLGRFKHFRRYGNVYKVQSGNMTKIRIGFFDTVDEAKKVVNQLKKKGIREAFIVGDNLQTAKLEVIATARDKMAGKVDIEDVSFKHNSPYKIRVVSYHFPNRFNTAEVADLGRIEHWTKDDWKIIILSGYENLSEARRMLNKVKQRGFKDAYIVKETFGKLQRVKFDNQ